MRLLLVEADNHVAALLPTVLARHGFDVTRARGGEEALRALAADAGGFDIVLLDVDLPDQDGHEVCGEIRRRTSIPVIMVSARWDVRSRIRGLYLGADDYIAKPYHTGELLARIHAVSRRSVRRDAAGEGETELRLGQVHIDLETRQVGVNGSTVHLTRKEFELLALLARRPGVVVTQETIRSEVWGVTSPGQGGRTLWVHVASLRSKLRVPDLIETVRGVGYRLVVRDA
ncbi:response regulator transcription factor [Streptomyces sp. SCL15-4]|uniref:response regulator transcription factor n=1 Tax=Streptomyces sp. SCL15-4 TaxID=2967221 RepID=UPI0029664C0F|nr:response regulator transcription factor [Streptomyces sp. SCL15-4]